MVMHSFEEGPKQQVMAQKFDEHQSNFSSRQKSNVDQSAADENRLMEEFNIQFFEKFICKNHKIQKIISEAFEKAEQALVEILNTPDYQRFKQPYAPISTQNSPRKKSPRQIIDNQQERANNQASEVKHKEQSLQRPSIRKNMKEEYRHSKNEKNTSEVQNGIFMTQEKEKSNNAQNTTAYTMTRNNFKRINAMLEDLEQTDETKDNERQDLEYMIQESEDSKALARNHGKKLKNLLEKWYEQEEYRQVIDDPRLDKHHQQTWGELIDFEKKLKEEMAKQNAVVEGLKYFVIRNIDWVKQKTCFYIDSLEQALIDCKLENNLKQERLSMVIEDHESRAFNVLDNNDFLKSALEVEREIADQKEINTFRGAITQVNRLKTVLEMLHKDYIKMVQQSKHIQDEVQELKTLTANQHQKITEYEAMNENLIDIIQAITKTAILYKDEEVTKTCRKQIQDCDPKVSTNLISSINRFISFMRMYPPVDLVTPLRKEAEQMKQLLYVMIDYLQGSGQLIKYWIPQFEDTEDQHKLTLDGWHKNYLVTVFENETLQFLQRFRQNNLELPFKYLIPQHVVERQLKLNKASAREIKLDAIDIDQTSEQQRTGDKAGLITEMQGDEIMNSSRTNNKVPQSESAQIVSQNKGATQVSNLNTTKQKLISGTLKHLSQYPQLLLNKQESQAVANNQFAKKKPSVSPAAAANKKDQIQALPDSSSNKQSTSAVNKRKIMRENTKSQESFTLGKDKKMKNKEMIILAKSIKLPPTMLQSVCDLIAEKTDKDLIKKILEKSKKRELDINKLGKSSQQQDILTEQESKIYNQILENNPKQSIFMDAFNLLKTINEFSQNYYSEAYNQKDSDKKGENSQRQDDKFLLKAMELFDYNNRLFSFNVEKSLEYLSKQTLENQDIIPYFKILVKLNSFIVQDEVYTNDLESFLENQKSKFKEIFNVPNDREHKILRKSYKIRNNLRKLLDFNNLINEDFKQFDESRLKKADIYDLLSEPLYKEGLHSLSVLDCISTYVYNLQNLTSDESFTLTTDLIKYQVDHSQALFEEYIKERNKNIPSAAIVSETIKAEVPLNVDATQLENLTKQQNDLLKILSSLNLQINVPKTPGGTDIDVELLTPLSSKDQSKTQSQISNSDNGGSFMPIPNMNHRVMSEQTENGGARANRQLELIRKETIKTIHALQDFVRSSKIEKKPSFRHKNLTLVKVNSIKTISYGNTESKNDNQLTKKPSKFGRNSATRKDSQGSIQIEESSEDSSPQSQTTLQKYASGPKSNHSKNSLMLTTYQEQKSVSPSKFNNQKKDESSKSSMLNLNSFNDINPHQKRSLSMKKTEKTPLKHEIEEIQDQKSNQDLWDSKSGTPHSRQKSGNSYIRKNHRRGEKQQVEVSQEIKDYQTVKEQELFGGDKNQMKELETSVYLKKMKEFDLEIEKLKQAYNNKKQAQSFTKMMTKRGRQQSNLTQINDSIFYDISRRLTQLEEHSSKPHQQINFVNSNVNLVDNSFVPDQVLKKIRRNQNISSQRTQNKSQDLSGILVMNSKAFKSQIIDKNLKEQRKKIVGPVMTKEEKFSKLYGAKTQLNSPNNGTETFFAQDHNDIQEQTARFSLKHQNTTLYALSNHSGKEKLKPKYSRKDVVPSGGLIQLKQITLRGSSTDYF